MNAARTHLLAELDRIELLVRRHAARLRDAGVDPFVDPPAAAGPDELALRALADEAVRAAGTELPYPRLARLARLGELEQETLLLCAGAELDLNWERLLAFAHDDARRTRPTVQLALDLFCSSLEERLDGRRLLADGPLVRDGLAHLVDDGGPLPGNTLALDERVLVYLLGEDAVDPALAGRVHTLDHAPRSERLHLGEAAAALTDGIAVVLQGRADPGGDTVAAALGDRVGLQTIAIDLRASPRDVSSLALAVRREARLRNVAVYLAAADELPFELVGLLAAGLADAGLPLIVRAREPLADPWPHTRFALDLARLDATARRRRWSDVAAAAGVDLAPAVVDEVASKLALGEEQTRAVVVDAQRRAASGGRELGVDDVDAAARAAAGAALAGVATKLDPRYGWDDLVLPERQRDGLRGLCGRVRRRLRVYETWGFAPVGASDGVVALFHGASGTGKTMAAEVLARELGLDLYRIDLAGLVSKYIGETEKNLRRVFQAAATVNAILLFDEAEALFGRRSEVKDAHDRYANIETAYLLGELETFPGLTVLATNLASNIDDAFRRRIHVAVEFPLPDVRQREQIWRRALAPGAPRADDVDLRMLAQRIEISGAVIRSACLGAAFAAAEDGGVITLAQLVRATAAELEKLGRPPTRGEFGELHHLIAR